jgi:hypothetical protein
VKKNEPFKGFASYRKKSPMCIHGERAMTDVFTSEGAMTDVFTSEVAMTDVFARRKTDDRCLSGERPMKVRLGTS